MKKVQENSGKRTATEKRRTTSVAPAVHTVATADVSAYAELSEEYLDQVEEEVDALFEALVTLVGCAKVSDPAAAAAHKMGLKAFAAARQDGVWFRAHLRSLPKAVA